MTQRIQPLAAAFARKLHLLAFTLTIVACLAPFAASALAAKTRHPIIAFDAGYSVGVAIEEDSGNVFVIDSATHSVRIFGAEGGVPSGVAPPFEIAGVGTVEGGIAIDNSATSPSKGALYVVRSESTVKKFVRNPISERYELEEELSAAPALEQANSVAVDSKGNVFVGDRVGEAVVEFGPTGTEIARLDVSASVGESRSVAVDSAGDLIIVGYGTPWVYRFDANGLGEIEADSEPVQIVRKTSEGEPRASSVAVDLSTDALYVGMDNSKSSKDNHVDQYSASCTPIGEDEHCTPEGDFGAGALTYARSVAINSNTDYVYVANPSNGESQGRVAVFGPPLFVPGSITGEATSVTGTGAVLNGTVDPSGFEVNECKFEWGVSESYGEIAPCAESPIEIGVGNTPVAVHADISGLGFGNGYHFRLVATNDVTLPNEIGPSRGADALFTTLGPQVRGVSVSGVGDTTAKLEGLVNPNKEDTSYVFEYVSQADFEAGEYAKATGVPLGGEAIGAGNADIAVAQEITGLSALTTYYFRLTATNPTGAAHGPDRTFTTYAEARAGLPDGRVYEQVTPIDKNGANPSGGRSLVQAAIGGGGITYAAGGGIPGGDGAQQYPTYLASRGSDWSTQGLLPPASGGSAASVLGWSDDLSRTYVIQGSVPGSPVDFLQRESINHSQRSIATGQSFSYVDASIDSSVVAFESDTVLPPGGAAKAPNFYVWDADAGELSLAGVFNSGQVPAKGTRAGSNGPTASRHYTQDQHTISNDGTRVFFNDPANGQLYLRQNPSQPQSKLGSEGRCTEAAMACTIQVSASRRVVPDPKGKKPALFMAATPDGSKAFFTSQSKLTDDATTGPDDDGNDLYRYDVESDELTDLTPDAGDPNGAEVQGVLGASDDGSYVYFAANGALSKDATPGNCGDPEGGEAGTGTCNLYLWHDEAVVLIAQVTLAVTDANSDSVNWFSENGKLGAEKTARVTPDGKTLLFRSNRHLTTYESHGTPEFFLYSASDGDLKCVSCSPTGADPRPVGAAPRLRSIVTTESSSPARVLTRNLSADGRRVFFETADKLIASDTNGDESCPLAAQGYAFTCQDVYEWEADGTGSCESEAQNGGCLYLLSSGTGSDPSYFGDASTDGEDAFLFTEKSLVSQDEDQLMDIYDARVGGGIASQNPAPPPIPCEGEACKVGVSTPPANESPGSASFSGAGNQKPTRHTKKKHHHKKKQQKKRRSARKSG